MTGRVIRTAAGTRITPEDRKGLDVPAAPAAVRGAAVRLEAEQGDDRVAA